MGTKPGTGGDNCPWISWICSNQSCTRMKIPVHSSLLKCSESSLQSRLLGYSDIFHFDQWIRGMCQTILSSRVVAGSYRENNLESKQNSYTWVDSFNLINIQGPLGAMNWVFCITSKPTQWTPHPNVLQPESGIWGRWLGLDEATEMGSQWNN